MLKVHFFIQKLKRDSLLIFRVVFDGIPFGIEFWIKRQKLNKNIISTVGLKFELMRCENFII